MKKIKEKMDKLNGYNVQIHLTSFANCMQNYS